MIFDYTDGYKIDHRSQYPKGTTKVRSNWTARSSRIPGVDRVIFFGLQYFIKEYLIQRFNCTFFDAPLDEVLPRYKQLIESYLGVGAITYDHIAALHELGYLPISIEAAPEGYSIPLRTPMFFIENTVPEFFWLTNYLETMLSASLWLPCTSATTAVRLRSLLWNAAEKTGVDPEWTAWQGHDFSFRGMGSIESAILSGMAHLIAFTGTDSIPAIPALVRYYNADPTTLIGGSVPATEHSVMCMGEQLGELQTFRRMINEVYPKGIVSIVSDTWDYWKVIGEYLPELKEVVMARDGKVVIRPDSGDPVKIICGDPEAEAVIDTGKVVENYKVFANNLARIGTVQALWNIFGGKTNEAGYKELDPHIGLIYGDGINYDRAKEIVERLQAQGFASNNIVFGIGSYTYQYVTRDTFGFAIKSTYGEIDGKPVSIFKDPKTDDGGKKSAKGLIQIVREPVTGRILGHTDSHHRDDWLGSGYEIVFSNGKLLKENTLEQIRERVRLSL